VGGSGWVVTSGSEAARAGCDKAAIAVSAAALRRMRFICVVFPKHVVKVGATRMKEC
jgi:hypothetical protein